ncbi:hypothetical protein AWC38_SpisGene14363 [Stylophora pistillata]|uniref:Prokineticin domain-containing protein n=2 Tax=Stylophora pistillata TaxID=50429 RepID=A0A2B4RWJ2_STYPI|nr:hypothetical protein AWC38_SpisGene14363 [Stylophora pistillata]
MHIYIRLSGRQLDSTFRGFSQDSRSDRRTSIKMKSFLLCTVVFTSLLSTSIAQKPFVKCSNHSECSPKQCCAGLSSTLKGVCLHQPQLKEPCNPYMKPGSMTECPCRLGMVCVPRRDSYSRCQYISTNPDEIDESRLLP